MKEKMYLKNTLLAVELALVCLIVILVRTFRPGAVLLRLDIPQLVLLSVVPMIAACNQKVQAKENLLCSALAAGVIFAALPFAAGWDTGITPWKLFLEGTLVFGVTNVLFDSMAKRISSGPKAPLALTVNGLMLYLASQCLQAIF